MPALRLRIMLKRFGVPMSFEDQGMESRYRNHFVGSILDRTRSLGRLVFPCLAVSELSWLLFATAVRSKVAAPDVILISVTRVLLRLILAAIYFNVIQLGEAWMLRMGIVSVWLTRFSAIGATFSQNFSSTASIICLSGVAIPSFAEYMLGGLLLAYARPCLSSLAPTEAGMAAETDYQNTLIFALGLSITWATHSDCRHRWLRTTAAPPRTRRRRAVPSAPSPHERGGGFGGAAPPTQQEWEVPDDGYFTTEDGADVRSDAVQVSHASLRAARAASARELVRARCARQHPPSENPRGGTAVLRQPLGDVAGFKEARLSRGSSVGS